MNIEIANRLVQLRKEHGLSQEDLAEKLGLSRQAVSKWERAEASPDTDNLICLAKLYGVSLDELLSTDEKPEDIAKEVKEKERKEVHVDAGPVHIHVSGVDDDDNDDDDDDDDDDDRVEVVCGDRHIVNVGGKKKMSDNAKVSFITTGTMLGLGFIAMIIVGVAWEGIGWQIGWTFLLDALWLGSIAAAVRHNRIIDFVFPLLVTSVYCKLGFLGSHYGFDGWGFYWFLFLLIPAFYLIAGPIDKYRRHGKRADED